MIKGENRVMLGVLVSPAAKTEIKAEADKHSLSMSEFSRHLLAMGLRHWKRGER